MKTFFILLVIPSLIFSATTIIKMKGSVYCGKDPIRATIKVMDKEIVKDDVVASFTTNVDPDNVKAQSSPLCMEPSRFYIEATHSEFSGGDYYMTITPKCKTHRYCEEVFTIDWQSVEGGTSGDLATGEYRKKLFGIDVCSSQHREVAKNDPLGYEKWLLSQRSHHSTPSPKFIPFPSSPLKKVNP